MKDIEMDSYEFAKFMQDIIQKEVRKEISKMQLPKSWAATVVSVSGSNAVVQLAGIATSLSEKKNKTGVTLVANDEVYLYSPTGELSNSYINVKK